MFRSIGIQIKTYLKLLAERPPKKPSKRKLRRLQKKEAKRLKREAKKGKVVLKPAATGEDEVPAATRPGTGVAAAPAPKIPEIHVCMNCGTRLQGKFCHVCGQKDSDYRRPYWTFLEDISDNVISKDSRLWRTLGYLLFLPGAMTREYIAGKRIRFLPPIRTFLISIVIFFLTVNVLDVAIVKFTGEPITYDARLANIQEDIAKNEDDIVQFTADDRTASLERALDRRARYREQLAELEDWKAEQLAAPDQSTVHRTDDGQLIRDYDVATKMFSPISKDDKPIPEEFISEEIQIGTRIDGDDEDSFLSELEPKVERGLKNAAQDPRRLNNALNNWVPIIMGIFVPLTALLLRMYYWKREHYLFNQLIFSLHFHTYLFFVLTFFVLAQVYLGSSTSTWMFAGAVPLYFLIALKVATGQGWLRTFFKFLVISFFYFIGFSMMLAAVFIAAFSEA